MKNSKTILHTFLHSLAVLIYVMLVAGFLSNASSILGETDTFLSPVIALLLLVISATIVGLIVLTKPISLFLAGNKTDALAFVGLELSWLVLMVIGVLTYIVVTR